MGNTCLREHAPQIFNNFVHFCKFYLGCHWMVAIFGWIENMEIIYVTYLAIGTIPVPQWGGNVWLREHLANNFNIFVNIFRNLLALSLHDSTFWENWESWEYLRYLSCCRNHACATIGNICFFREYAATNSNIFYIYLGSVSICSHGKTVNTPSTWAL